MTTTRFEDWEAKKMRDPKFRSAVEELEPAYQITRLRILRGLTQEELARRMGTRQSSIARLESGRTEPSLSFLRRAVQALGGRLEVRIVAQEEAEAIPQTAAGSTIEPQADSQATIADPLLDPDIEAESENAHTFEPVGAE